MAGKKCPREGTKVVFDANPAAVHAFYGTKSPKTGEFGKLTTIPVPGGRKTCMGGPRGGIVFVDWEKAGTVGVYRFDVKKESGGLLGGCGGKRRRKGARR